ncbi:YkgJ family cysteine cluster protein [Thermodesulfobium sp.]|jgi:Fe-S-cluster containining protein
MKDILNSIEKLYKEVEDEFEKIGRYYDFSCFGCTSNCCTTLFYHYTFVEEFILQYGLSKLENDKKLLILENSRKYLLSKESYNGKEKFKMMCPANKDGLCMIYEYRPMICRIHGIPSKLVFPNGRIDFYKGCEVLASKFLEFPYVLDRTPFFKNLSLLEIDFRKRINKPIKIKFKKTIAEMILSKELESIYV